MGLAGSAAVPGADNSNVACDAAADSSSAAGVAEANLALVALLSDRLAVGKVETDRVETAVKRAGELNTADCDNGAPPDARVATCSEDGSVVVVEGGDVVVVVGVAGEFTGRTELR